MNRPGRYGGHIELSAFCLMRDIEVRVYRQIAPNQIIHMHTISFFENPGHNDNPFIPLQYN